MKRYIGLRNIVTTKDTWSYLLLYEIDGHDEHTVMRLIDTYSRMTTSFICYKTKKGFHFVGLTPLDSQLWGLYFERLQRIVPEYYSGALLRLSLKEGELQQYVFHSLEYPFIGKLYHMYAKRFPQILQTQYQDKENNNYSCVYEKYWSVKI